MKKTTLLPLIGALILVVAGMILMVVGRQDRGVAYAYAGDADMVVFKSPTCGCCDLWIDHMRDHGFTVDAVDIVGYDDLVRKKRELGIPDDLGSCHTAFIDGYSVEGHVPAHAVRRLLRERPTVRGIAVPGMPIGSPGMEGPNPRPFDVIAFRRDGGRTVYQTIYPDRPASEAR